jgi:hypothetical protein
MDGSLVDGVLHQTVYLLLVLRVGAEAQLGERFAFTPRLQVDLASVRLLLQQQRQRVLQALQAGLERFEGLFRAVPTRSG